MVDEIATRMVPLTVWTFPVEDTAIAVIGDTAIEDPEVQQVDFD